MKHKRGTISILMAFFLIAVTVLIIWVILAGGINKAFGFVIDSLKEKMGFGDEEKIILVSVENFHIQTITMALLYGLFIVHLQRFLVPSIDALRFPEGCIDYTLKEYS